MLHSGPEPAADKLRDSRYRGVREVKRSSKSKTGRVRTSEQAAKALLPALAVVGGSLVALPAHALELGDLQVHSSLGQPLRASIAYALAPNEIVSDTCVSVQQVMSADRLPSVGKASLIVTNGVIAITGSRVVQEPLMSMRVTVDCPYTPHISREYTLFVDPVAFQPATDAQPAPQPQAAAAPVPARHNAPAARAAARHAPIGAATRYRVRVGDSLSEIAARIENRPVGLWPAVTAIFEANPDAFLDNDPNKLKAGSWLDIPDFGAGTPPVVAERVRNAPAPVSEVTQTGTAYEPATGMPAESAPAPDLRPAEPTTVSPAAAAAAGTAESPATVAPAETPARGAAEAADSPFVDLQPGDVIREPASKAAATGAGDRTTIPDTSLEGPRTTSSSPNGPVAVIRPASDSTARSTHWLVWLIGGGIALIAGLLAFGRFRDRFGSSPMSAASPHPLRRHSDGDTQRVEAIPEVHADADVVTIDDDSPTAENLALDADLEIGTGLREGTDVDIAQDFAFASTTALDLELPEEMSSGGDESRLTDVLPPLHAGDLETILESEVLPGEADDYDMSVIMDATKVPLPEDITERDLEAVALPADDETLITDDYTVSQEVDYKILEQDYEDEMTATQALNAEISRAAEELAARMEEDSDTTGISMASVHELDVTAQLRSGNDDDIGDLDDTGINEQTVSLEAGDKTVEMNAGEKDKTAEMPIKKRRGA